jgi:hypothetical protein
MVGTGILGVSLLGLMGEGETFGGSFLIVTGVGMLTLFMF